ncbi:EAL domain-containing protein [bacterium]|nr:EAL domain-containing protein [bacterium]
MAFQPIADLELRTTFACEALLRGDGGAGAYEVLDRIPRSERCAFDEACWDTAFALTTELDLRTALSLNVHPSTFARGGLRNVLLAARHFAFPPDRLILELTEDEWVSDVDLIQASREEARAAGVRVALDDLGAGFAGLNLLADLQPDLVKLDRGLVRGIDSSRPRRAIVKGVLAACRDSGVEVIAEGVEGVGELSAVWDLGARPSRRCRRSRGLRNSWREGARVRHDTRPSRRRRASPPCGSPFRADFQIRLDLPIHSGIVFVRRAAGPPATTNPQRPSGPSWSRSSESTSRSRPPRSTDRCCRPARGRSPHRVRASAPGRPSARGPHLVAAAGQPVAEGDL